MIDILLLEPVQSFLQQWPMVAIIAIVAYAIQRDLRDCIDHNEDVIDKLLDYITSSSDH